MSYYGSYEYKNKTINTNKEVVSIDVSVVVEKCEGEVRVTDIMLQSGDTALTWNAHPSEIKWTVDN